MQETRVWSLVWEDPTCHGATKPMCHNYCASNSRNCKLQPPSGSAAITEAHTPRACAPKQEKPLQWEVCAPQGRVAPIAATRESPCKSNEDPAQRKINWLINFKKRLYASNAGDTCSVPGLRTRIPHATGHGQKKKWDAESHWLL